MESTKTINWRNGRRGAILALVTFIVTLGVLGMLAGALTTVAGLGGGLLLLISLSLVTDPLSALAMTTPALLIGNLHRSWVFRARVQWPIVRAFALGAVPGAALGSLAAVAVPLWMVNGLMLGITLLSLARAFGKLELTPPRGAFAPAGFVIGGLTGSAGGAAVLTAPLFLSAGLSGETYSGTIAAAAVAMHLGRIAGYGAGGLLTRDLWLFAALLSVAVVAGNGVGRRARRWTERLPAGAIEHATLVICALLAVAGVSRS